ncbi:MAG: hypothetical protein EYC70_11700 [Planctomycetota bacterium]|nr:MAG: hypothetical protein EYC70_11700 [Planctomycetota bacterium]
MQPPVRPRRYRRARGGRQRGVVLILTLFVLLITYALVAQLILGTSVADTSARNSANHVRMRVGGASAAQQILDTLRDDAPQAGGGMGGSGGMGGVGDAGGQDGSGFMDPRAQGGSGAGGDSGTGGGQEEGEEDDGSNSDSWEDPWARPLRIMMGDIQVTAWAEDENAKFNLLALVAEDEEYREEARERCTRILDFLRDDLDGDLDSSEARQVMEEIVTWLEGSSRSTEYPRPDRHSNPEDEDRTLMGSLEELLLLEHVTPELYYDQVLTRDRIAPGLETVFTIWTQVAVDTPQPPGQEGGATTGSEAASGGDGGEAAGSPDGDSGGAAASRDFGGGQAPGSGLGQEGGGAAPQSGAQDPAGGGGQQQGAGGSQMVGVRLNLNTMPRPVLQGLLPSDELSPAAVNEILEYRNKVDEEALAERESEDLDSDQRAFEEALYGEDEPEPKHYFKSMSDLDQIETLKDRTDQEVRARFQDLVGVQSDVFSVYLYVRIPPRDWRPESRYDEPPGPVLRLRAIVWRRQGAESAEFLFLQNWREIPYTRWRIPDFQDELEPFKAPEF